MEFDKKYFQKYWEEAENIDGKIEFIKDMVIALTGEMGEFANLVKKISRERKITMEVPSKEMMESLKEELIDCFIYIIILSNILEVDIEKEYLKKTELNHQRFKKYIKKIK